MRGIAALILVNVGMIGMGILIDSGKADQILTISFGKNEMEKSKINIKRFRQTTCIVLILLDLFASALVLANV